MANNETIQLFSGWAIQDNGIFLVGPERITEFILAGLGNDNGIYTGWLRKGQRNFVLAGPEKITEFILAQASFYI